MQQVGSLVDVDQARETGRLVIQVAAIKWEWDHDV